MKTNSDKAQSGNGLVVVISVVATILAILGAAVSYTGHISRISQRSRRTALAMEIADGHLEYLFTNWRNIYRKTWTTYNTN
jgi:Tfp pilus assembly protein PilX